MGANARASQTWSGRGKAIKASVGIWNDYRIATLTTDFQITTPIASPAKWPILEFTAHGKDMNNAG